MKIIRVYREVKIQCITPSSFWLSSRICTGMLKCLLEMNVRNRKQETRVRGVKYYFSLVLRNSF